MLNIFVTRLPNLLMVMNMLVIVVLAFCLFFGGEAGAAEAGTCRCRSSPLDARRPS